jgi:5-methylcytosine-specific restriction endonuclease McrA
MKNVLLLNQSYEPLLIINWKKAILLSLLNKAEIIKEYNSIVRSQSFSMKLPSVIRLTKKYYKPKFQKIRFNKKNVLIRDGFKCQYCGKVLEEKSFTCDHVIPKSKGGKSCWTNIVSCCSFCNLTKANKNLKETGMKLIKEPSCPSVSTFFYLKEKDIPDEWREFYI